MTVFNFLPIRLTNAVNKLKKYLM